MVEKNNKGNSLLASFNNFLFCRVFLETFSTEITVTFSRSVPFWWECWLCFRYPMLKPLTVMDGKVEFLFHSITLANLNILWTQFSNLDVIRLRRLKCQVVMVFFLNLTTKHASNDNIFASSWSCHLLFSVVYQSLMAHCGTSESSRK